MIRVGTAGWSLPTKWQSEFPEGKTHLHRYARVLSAVEIDSTFYKLPMPSTVERWRESVPGEFRFSVKLPRQITHRLRLESAAEPLRAFLEVAEKLGDRLGPLLIQLPPSLAFDVALAESFLEELRELRAGPDALEARHPSWFAKDAEALLAHYQMARVAADPPRAETDGVPGGDTRLAYFRLHGKPVLYRSPYRTGALDEWAGRIRRAADESEEVWCIFDNTGAGEGAADALALCAMFGTRS